MELKTKVSIEVSRQDGETTRHYQFILPYGAPLGEVYDVCHDMLQEIVKMAQNAADKAKKEEDQNKD